jgi:tetratricopeptide (TPR) repeat protein
MSLSTPADSRIAKLRAFAEARPQDPFPRYALALEHRNAGDHTLALAVFQELIAAHPDYVPAYLHAGNASVAAGDKEGARGLWQRGLETARKKGDGHAAGELEGALGSL